MAFQVSPGVQVREIDLTTIIPAVSTTIAGFAGRFQWGTVGERVTVSSINDLTEAFQYYLIKLLEILTLNLHKIPLMHRFLSQ